MSDLSASTSSEKIVLLLDGELSHAEEAPLFTDLASNDELRTEMRELISIKNIVKNDNEAFMPPIAVTAGVFSSAGFNLPAYVSGVGALLLKYSWIPLLLATITGVTTFLIMDNNFNVEKQDLLLGKSNLNNQLLLSRSEVESLENRNLELQNKLNEKPATIVKYVKVPVVQSVESPQSAINETETISTLNKAASPSLSYSRVNYNSYSSGPMINDDMQISSVTNPITASQLPIYNPITGNIRIKEDVYYMTFSGISALAFPFVNASVNSASMTNFALGFYFLSPYKNVIIGAEAGREPFSQSFINTENSKRFIYEQQPNIWWAGTSVVGTLDYKIDELFGAQPYGKLFVGASEIGPLGKAGAGLKWVSSSLGFGAFLGVEGSFLGYQNQGSWYTSGKIGFSYGLSIQF